MPSPGRRDHRTSGSAKVTGRADGTTGLKVYGLSRHEPDQPNERRDSREDQEPLESARCPSEDVQQFEHQAEQEQRHGELDERPVSSPAGLPPSARPPRRHGETMWFSPLLMVATLPHARGAVRGPPRANQIDRARISARSGTPAKSSRAVLFTSTTARTAVPPTSSTRTTFFPWGDA